MYGTMQRVVFFLYLMEHDRLPCLRYRVAESMQKPNFLEIHNRSMQAMNWKSISPDGNVCLDFWEEGDRGYARIWTVKQTRT